ncbi:glutathione S-transferase family protein [Paraburkholderia pallida]|uniref:Glutathione S-transferase n=1 Tax=Paraburkholderia pallida TaxID=2547399 RepID=A0A4P7D223_9BURK|nr:glutathione S-transferase N-terminal domain-containing protein [Paraburkholderia pallida]QBR01948.1 glutathione S-transferase [Paraburkholderia pallida]
MNEPETRATPPALTLYYSPKACSLASHIALEASGLAYRAVSVDIRAGQNRQAAYLKIHPGGIVPALEAGGEVITESQAILTYVADLAPESELIPRPGTRARARAHEWMNWISSTLHVRYRSIFRPQTYAGESAAAADAVREHARLKLADALIEIEARLGQQPYALDTQFSVVDAYLFVFYLWSHDERIATELPQRPRYQALAARLFERPAVRTVLARERAVRAYDLPPEFSIAIPE